MLIIYTLGGIFGLTLGLLIALFIITRPEKRFDLTEESYELKTNNHDKNSRTAKEKRD